MNQPKVSVIIPVYNTEKYLRECLDSVVNQTLREIEIICVDDGSTDGSFVILEEYAVRDERFSLMRQQNSGSGAARNKGILSAKGEYVVFMDSDDLYPEKTTLEKLYKAASTHDAIICGGSFSSFRDGGDGRIVNQYSGLFSGYTFREEGEVPYSDYQFDFGYHRFLYRRAFLLENGILFPDYLRFQDPPFFVKAMITAQKFYAICDATYLYREQHRDIAASEKKSIDVVRGLTDNIRMALENDLQQLYELTVTRCCQGVLLWPALLAVEQSDKEEARAALRELNRSVDLKRLYGDISDAYKLHLIRDHQLYQKAQRSREQQLHQDAQRIKEQQLHQDAQRIREHQLYQDSQRELKRTKYDLDCVHASASFRIGRAITWLPRKVWGGVRCLREHDLAYTFNRALVNLHLRKE